MKTGSELRFLLGPSGNIGNAPRVGYVYGVSWLIQLTHASQLILPVKGTIRDHKEFWGLSPNVQFANCDVNPVSGHLSSIYLGDTRSLTVMQIGITKIVRLQDQLVTYKFVLPHNRQVDCCDRSFTNSPNAHSGKIHLISGSVRYNVEADEIFREYQEHANNGSLPFRRFPMKAHICESLVLLPHIQSS